MTPQIATITLNPAIDQTAAISNFRSGEVNRVTWEQSDPGGKGVNVASFLSDFGLTVSASGFLGKENVELFRNFFSQKQIRDRFIPIAGSTRTNIKIIDEVQNQVTDINFPGQAPTIEDVESLRREIDQLAIDHNWFVLSGSLPANVSPNIYFELTERLKSKGKTVILDASGDSLRQAIRAAPFAIKPNLEELQEGLGRSLQSNPEIVQVARELIDRGIHCIAVSMGANGAIFVEAQSAVWARPPRVEVVSTVGAGDAMVSGLVIAKLRGLTLADAARLATACSIGALSQVGSRLPPQAAIESFSTQVQIETLD